MLSAHTTEDKKLKSWTDEVPWFIFKWQERGKKAVQEEVMIDFQIFFETEQVSMGTH